MKVKFLDSKGSEKNLIFNPQISWFKDGTVVIYPSNAWINGYCFELPLYSGEPKELWVDIEHGIYDIAPSNSMAPGSFRFLFIIGDVIHIVRYKEKLEETFINKIKRVIHAIT